MKTSSFFMLMVVVCFARCSEITLEPLAQDLSSNDKPSFKGARISFKNDDGSIKDIFKANLEVPDLRCITKGQSLEISSEKEVDDTSEAYFIKSINFEDFESLSYKQHTIEISTTSTTSKVCFLFGYYSNGSANEKKISKLRIYLNFLSDSISIDLQDLLFLQVHNDSDDFFVNLSKYNMESNSESNSDRKNIKELLCGNDRVTINVDFILNKQPFSLPYEGMFAMAFLNKSDVTSNKPTKSKTNPSFKCSKNDITILNLAGSNII